MRHSETLRLFKQMDGQLQLHFQTESCTA